MTFKYFSICALWLSGWVWVGY